VTIRRRKMLFAWILEKLAVNGGGVRGGVLMCIFLDWNDAEPIDEELRVVWFGWPKEGGLLVIQFEQDERPDDIVRLRMAVIVKERCKLLTERIGAKVYEDPALYDGLADVF